MTQINNNKLLNNKYICIIKQPSFSRDTKNQECR
jgi:hypothetical protein